MVVELVTDLVVSKVTYSLTLYLYYLSHIQKFDLNLSFLFIPISYSVRSYTDSQYRLYVISYLKNLFSYSSFTLQSLRMKVLKVLVILNTTQCNLSHCSLPLCFGSLRLQVTSEVILLYYVTDYHVRSSDPQIPSLSL